MNDQTFDYASFAKMPITIRKTLFDLVDRLAPAEGSAAYMMIYEQDPDPELREQARLELEKIGVHVGETDRPLEGNPGETHYQVDDPSLAGAKTIALDGGDGQIKTPAQLADTPNLFILDRSQRGFLNGKSPHPARRLVYGSGLFLFIWTAVSLVILAPFSHFPLNSGMILFLLVIVLGEIASILIFITVLRRTRRLEALGKLLQGQIISASGRWVRHNRTTGHGHRTSSRSFDVTISYTFRTPEGQRLTSSSTQTRGDLKDQPMPDRGMPVAVLYVDDKTYMLL